MAQAQPDVAAKRQVSESALLHLHAQIVEYNMLGHGAKFFDAPRSSAAVPADGNLGDDDADDDTKDAGTTGEKDERGQQDKKSTSRSKSQKSGGGGGLQQAAKWRRLEALGQDIGRRIAERHAHYRDRMEQDLEKVKFICKEFWESTFRKQVDVLRTNHRGLYVLTDNNFSWLASVCPPKTSSSTSADGSTQAQKGQKPKQKQAMEQDTPDVVSRLTAEDLIVLPCGIICGALTRLGLRCRVTADLFPTDDAGYRVSFNVQLVSSN